tara:strand:- start:499 stop:684 length:186 start_codon:yes stop_codon:yes gene_type:complete
MHPALFMIVAKMGEKFAEEVGTEVVKTIAREVWGEEIDNDEEVKGLLADFKGFLDDNNLRL